MAIYTNMNRKYLRTGGRSAYTMTTEQLEELLTMVLPRFCDCEEGEEPDMTKDYEKEHCLISALGEFEGERPFTKVSQDLRKVCFSKENVIMDGFVLGSNGVPALQLKVGGDWEVPVRVFIYWDGKTFRGYVPVYGNSYNPYTKTAFGSEEEQEKPDYGKEYWLQASEPGTKPFHELASSDLPVNEPTALVLSEQQYEDMQWGWVQYNEAACLEDFSCRVTAKGELSAEMYVKALESMTALGKKNVWLEDEE